MSEDLKLLHRACMVPIFRMILVFPGYDTIKILHSAQERHRRKERNSCFMITCSQKPPEFLILLAFRGYDTTPAAGKSRTLPPVAKLDGNPYAQMPALQAH